MTPAAASFTCPRCGATSRSPDDIREGYCGRCHDWTRDAEQVTRVVIRWEFGPGRYAEVEAEPVGPVTTHLSDEPPPDISSTAALRLVPPPPPRTLTIGVTARQFRYHLEPPP